MLVGSPSEICFCVFFWQWQTTAVLGNQMHLEPLYTLFTIYECEFLFGVKRNFTILLVDLLLRLFWDKEDCKTKLELG
jgi:hypothetical protein